LELWQKAFVAAIYGFVGSNGLRKHTKALLVVARKNGKSTLSSSIGLYMQVADGEAGPEIFAVATKKDQAKIIWLEAKRMVKKIKCLVAELVGEHNDSFFKFLASDSDNLDGLNPHCALADEIHAWKDQNLYDVIYDGMSARTQPLFLETTTAGTVREAVFDQEYAAASQSIFEIDGFKDDRLFAAIYELDNREEWKDPAMHIKANPGLGTIKDSEKLLDKVNAALANPTKQSNLLCKDFNVRDTVAGSWLNFDEINNEEIYKIEDFKDTYAVGGVDLSSTTDLTCATLLWKKDNKLYVRQMYFIARDIAEQKEHDDRVPYSAWEKQDLVKLCDGQRVNYSDVTAWFIEMRETYGIFPLWVGYDSWSAQYYTLEMQSNNFIMEEVRQGPQTMSAPMKELAAEFKERKINYNNNPLLKWNLTNTQVEIDKNDNIRPVKGRNSKQRIDGTVSLIDAYVIYVTHYEDYHNLI